MSRCGWKWSALRKTRWSGVSRPASGVSICCRMQLVAPFLTVAARLKRMYADVPCPNAEVNARFEREDFGLAKSPCAFEPNW